MHAAKFVSLHVPNQSFQLAALQAYYQCEWGNHLE